MPNTGEAIIIDVGEGRLARDQSCSRLCRWGCRSGPAGQEVARKSDEERADFGGWIHRNRLGRAAGRAICAQFDRRLDALGRLWQADLGAQATASAVFQDKTPTMRFDNRAGEGEA